MINLGDRQLNSLPGSAAGHRKTHAAVISHCHAIRIIGIDPNVVVVAAGTAGKAGCRAGGFAAIERDGVGCGKKIRFVFIIRRDGYAKIVMRAPAEIAIVTNQPPVLATIV